MTPTPACDNHHARTGRPALKSALMCIALASLAAGCATNPSQQERTAQDRERVDILLDRHAAQVASAWNELVAIEQGVRGGSAGAHQGAEPVTVELGRRPEAFVFSGRVEDFVKFVSDGLGWTMEPTEGRGAGVALVRLNSDGTMTYQEALEQAGAQVTGVADIVLSTSNRSIRVRYKGV